MVLGESVDQVNRKQEFAINTQVVLFEHRLQPWRVEQPIHKGVPRDPFPQRIVFSFLNKLQEGCIELVSFLLVGK